MDERQQQIREGAGLEESRLNVEFIDWLKKYSTPILLLIALIAGGYVGYQRYQQHRLDSLDAAFAELNAAQVSASPDTLLAVAQDHSGQGGVPYIARLQAADIFLQASRSGVRPGATPTPAGATENADDLLTDEQRTEYLGRAAAVYEEVLDDAGRGVDHAMYAIHAAFGLAAVAESRNDRAVAAEFYKQAADRADRARLAGLKKLADERLASLDTLSEVPRLYARADLPTPPAAPAVPGTFMPTQPIPASQMPVGGVSAIAPSGQPEILPPQEVGPAGPPIPGATGPQPQPAPAEPAPAPEEPAGEDAPAPAPDPETPPAPPPGG